jgi:threonyl-tRNA synthetase
VRVLSFTDRNIDGAKKVLEQIKKEIPNIRIDEDFSASTMGAKVKEAELMKIPYVITIGDKEEASGEIAVRIRGSSKLENLKVDKFISKIKKEIEERK